MLKWQDKGIVLSTRDCGEDATILSVFTRDHGRHLGVIKKTKNNAFLQPGNLVSIDWQSRLEDQIGYFRAELMNPYASFILGDKLGLSMLTSACALMEMSLSEREKDSELFDKTMDLVKDINLKKYCLWELDLLKSSGFALELSCCGETGSREDLRYVSPKTGRAICRTVGLPWHGRLLSYPDIFKSPEGQDYCAGLELTGFFLKNHVLNKLPDARIRLVKRISK